MLKQDHLKRLLESVEPWNQWRQEHSGVGPTLSGADLSGADIYLANLNLADLSEADLSGANLTTAKLSGADLGFANLSGANLRSANLSNAYLSRSQFLGTDFTGAILTGACIEDWNINSETRLNDVVCEYIFLKRGQQERRPSDPNCSFAPGEFVKLFQKVQETVDLIFRNGVDWQVLLISLEKLKVEVAGAELSIQAIENKNDGAFVVRVNVPPEANKAEVEQFLRREYDLALKAIDERYQYQLQAKDEQIAIYRQQSTDLMGIARLMASRPINVEAKAVAENQAPKFNFNAPVGNVADTIQSGGRQQNIQHNYAASPQQTLSEAAAEIQALLQQLTQTNPTATEAEQKAFVNAALPPTTRERILGAAQAGGMAVLAETQYGKIIKAIIEGWQQSK